jgi:hypothetical protein
MVYVRILRFAANKSVVIQENVFQCMLKEVIPKKLLLFLICLNHLHHFPLIALYHFGKINTTSPCLT